MQNFRPYQIESSDFLIQHHRAVLGLPPGTGKTRILIRCIEELQPPRILLVGSKIALKTWKKEWLKWGLDKWYPTPSLTIGKNQAQREKIWNNSQVVGTTFNNLPNDLNPKKNPNTPAAKQHFSMVIADEAHKANNRKKTFHKGLKQVSRNSRYCFIATGSPGKRGPEGLWGLLSLARPKEFTSFWGFINQYCFVDKNPWGGIEILGAVNQDDMIKDLENVLYYRSKKALLPELPEKQRQKMPFELTPTTRRVYTQLKEDLLSYLEASGDVIVAPNTLTLSIRLRQLLCCPAILSKDLGVGEAITSCAEYIEENQSHVVIFTFFKQAIPYIEQALQAKGFTDIFTITGGMDIDEMQKREDAFKKSQGIMLCTIQVAESFSLETCDTAHFIGADWDPENNYQAEDRIHRMTSDHQSIHCLYWVCENTIDDRVFEVLDEKSRFTKALSRSSDTLREALKSDH